MTSSRDIHTFIQDFSKEIEENNAAVFVGAGLSVGSGYVDWKGLLTPIANELGLSVDREHDLVSLAQFHANETGNRSKLNRLLIEEFQRSAKLTENHLLLARLPFASYWTTNYDRLIEQALGQENKRPDVKYTKAHMTQTRPGRDCVVYKMHGDQEHPDQAIITKDDYESFHRDRDLYLAALSGDLVSNTFLFLGFSFSDPNLDYILSRVRVSVDQQNIRQHFALLKKVSGDDFESRADFDYQTRRQELFVGDLKRFGIRALLIDSYAEITEILRKLHTIHKARSVLISGAAEDYAPWTANQAERLVREISGRLVEERFRIVSGFGLGIGSAVIAGALDKIYADAAKTTGDYLVLRPFPQGEHYREKYTQYRQDIASLAGIAIFVFGNKSDSDGTIIHSPGVEEEFEVAVEKGLFVVPVGSTGSMSRRLWQKVMDNFEEYYPEQSDLQPLFESLGEDPEGDDDRIVETVIQIVKRLRMMS